MEETKLYRYEHGRQLPHMPGDPLTGHWYCPESGRIEPFRIETTAVEDLEKEKER